MTIEFTVVGTPTPQGSMRGYVVGGRAVVTNANPKLLRTWRGAVVEEAMKAAALERFPRPLPVRVTAMFRLARPKSQTKAERSISMVAKKPDLDKLGRALLDSLTDARVFDDDAQVASLWLTKVYAEDDDYLGATIVVSAG